jgi:hypothetical protein
MFDRSPDPDGSAIDTMTPDGRHFFDIFGVLRHSMITIGMV